MRRACARLKVARAVVVTGPSRLRNVLTGTDKHRFSCLDASVFESLIRSIGDAVGVWMYVIAGALAFAEAAVLVGMVLPGETALLIAGFFCRAEYGRLNLGVMIAVAIVCAIAGDSVGYQFGRKFGPPLRRSRLGMWVGEPRWLAVDGFIHRHGGKAVLLGRLTALLRALTPSMAGMSGMRYRTFLVWNAVGGVVWGGGCVVLGYAFASALGVVGETLTWAPLAILAVIAVVAILMHLRKRRRENAELAEFAVAAPADAAIIDG
jgi:membrane protein DedA with SNARE-associated domain